MGESLRMFLGQKIREERLKHGWTIEELSESAEISSSFLGSVERGERSLSVENLVKFSNIFNVTIDSLIKKSITNESRSETINYLTKDLSETEFSLIVDLLRKIKLFFNRSKV